MDGPKTPCKLIIDNFLNLIYEAKLVEFEEKRKYSSLQHKGENYIRNVIDLKNEPTRLSYDKSPKHLPPKKVPSDQFLDSFSIALFCF